MHKHHKTANSDFKGYKIREAFFPPHLPLWLKIACTSWDTCLVYLFAQLKHGKIHIITRLNGYVQERKEAKRLIQIPANMEKSQV